MATSTNQTKNAIPGWCKAFLWFFGIAIAINVGIFLYECAIWLSEKITQGVITAGMILGYILAGIMCLFICTLLEDLIIQPIGQYLRWYSDTRRNIASCVLPKASTFRGGKSQSQVDRFLANLLRQYFFSLTGRFPGSHTLLGTQFMAFKVDHLHRIITKEARLQVLAIFIQVFGQYRAGGNKPLEEWINRLIEAGKRPHRLRRTGRFLYFVTFGRIGLSSDKAFVRLNHKDTAVDQKAICRLLFVHFWGSLPAIEDMVTLDLELDKEPDEVVVPEVQPEPVHQEPLPPPPPVQTEEPQPETEPEPVEEETEVLPEDELAERQAEAVRMTETAMSFFTRDNQAWDAPDKLIADARSVLESALEYHPDPDQVHEQFSWLDTREAGLETFEEDFEREMSRPRQPDELWKCPWLEKASVYLPTGLDGDFTIFKRNALRFYLLEDEVGHSEVGEKDVAELEYRESEIQEADGANAMEVLPPSPEGF